MAALMCGGDGQLDVGQNGASERRVQIPGPLDNSNITLQSGVIAVLWERIQKKGNVVVLTHLWDTTLLGVEVMMPAQLDSLVAVLLEVPVA
jgi:hypothetical protein